MKKALIIIALVAFVILAAAAQTETSPGSTTPSQPSAPKQADLLQSLPPLSAHRFDALVRFQTATASRVLGIDFTVDGVLPRVRRARNPLHLINPFAPAEYGYGQDIASINPRTGRAEGIVFWGIKF
jgi:hypothetical protein